MSGPGNHAAALRIELLMKHVLALSASAALLMLEGCSGGGDSPSTPTGQAPPPQATAQPTPVPTPVPTPTPPPSPTPSGEIADDAALFRLITRDEPFQSYRLFPNTTEISSGRLDGAGAHPMARVRLNTPAFQSLDNGRLSGGRFRNGSVLVKEIPSQDLYAVMRRTDGETSGAGWQWAEFRSDGRVVYSITNRGGACIECHSRQQGPQNDLVRTFERQQ